ncbi:unnamed protein product [Phytophthora lilii]|uniref:Unnamed protein product n=1 Tax=Phytophthora lilii TaxID=2077276 RepID=A0A9W6TJS6_9STRA|nr:unnamed protein product [Phytophthora lilii]
MWRNLAYGSQQAAEAAPTVAPTKSVKETVISQVDASSVPKNDGAKVYKILEYLRKVPMHKAVSVSDIFKHTGVIPEGMPIEDLIDCYVGVEDDLRELTRTGEIICLKNADKGAEVYYSRGPTFLVDLSGVATVEAGSYLAHSSQDLTGEIRRGDAFRLGDNWFRVSAAVKSSSTTRPAPFAGMATKSVSSTRDPNVSKKIKCAIRCVFLCVFVGMLANDRAIMVNRYMFKFDHEHLPMDVPFPDAKRRNVASSDRWDLLPKRGPKFQMVKHGTLHVIQLSVSQLCSDFTILQFEKKLVQAGLTTQAKVDASRRQMKRRLKEDKKKNRPRKQRDIKITNHHLIGTKLGEILAKGSQEQFTLGAVKFEKK